MSSSPAEECRSPVGLDCCSCCLDLANRSGLEEGAGGENNNPGSPTVSSFRQLREQLVRQNLNTDKLSSIMRQDSLEPVVRDPCYLFNQGICNRNIDQTLLSILLLFHRWVSPPGAAGGSELAALWGWQERGSRVTAGLGVSAAVGSGWGGAASGTESMRGASPPLGAGPGGSAPPCPPCGALCLPGSDNSPQLCVLAAGLCAHLPGYLCAHRQCPRGHGQCPATDRDRIGPILCGEGSRFLGKQLCCLESHLERH